MNATAPLQWRVDLHVHTRRYSPCAELLDPQDLPAAIAAMGLDGAVITEHDHLWSSSEIDQLNKMTTGPRIYRGVEVSSCNGHFLVIGLDRMDDLQPGVSALRVVQQAREQGAVVILAHPLLEYRQISAPLCFSSMPEGIDAIEVVSTMTIGAQVNEVSAYAKRLGYSLVGGSDAHALAQVGKAFTLFDHLPEDEKGLADAIRSGRCCASTH